MGDTKPTLSKADSVDRLDPPVILFDAHCVLCSANAQFVLGEAGDGGSLGFDA